MDPVFAKALDEGFPTVVRKLQQWRSYGEFPALTATLRLSDGDMTVTATADGAVCAEIDGRVIDLTHLLDA